jgi:antitoxin (DNA-binding transcriptional repressor) of toxin-antitoxin stability system
VRREITIEEAELHFLEIAKLAEAGDEIDITRDGKAVLKLLKYETDKTDIIPGFARESLDSWATSDWEKLDLEFNDLFKSNEDNSDK